MDFNNDIGSFGLPPFDDANNTKSSSRRHGGATSIKSSKSKKKLKNKTNNFNINGVHRQLIKSTTTTMTNTNGKMSKKKRKRLQQQHVNNREVEVDSSSDDESLALSQLAVATNKPAVSNIGAPRQHNNSNKVQRKDKKQVGLHSFLVKSTTSTDMSTSGATTNNGSNKKRPHSFISAKSIIINDNCVDVKS